MSDVDGVDAKSETPPSGDEQLAAKAPAANHTLDPTDDVGAGASALESEVVAADPTGFVNETENEDPALETGEAAEAEPQEPEPQEPDAPQTPDVVDIARIRALFTRVPDPASSDASPDQAEAAGGDYVGADEETAEDAFPEGPFVFAKWSRAIAPRLFGFDEGSAAGVLDGMSEAARRAGVEIVDEDPEFEANLLFFACEQWGDLLPTPGLDRLIPDLAKLIALLGATGANQYHIFSFDAAGGIQFAIVLVRVDEHIERQSPRALGLDQMTRVLLLWSDAAFLNETPITANRRGEARLKPWFVDLLAAAYDEETPLRSEDPALCDMLAVKAAERRAAAKEAAAEARAARRQNAEPSRKDGEGEQDGSSGSSKRRAQRRRRKGARSQEVEGAEAESPSAEPEGEPSPEPQEVADQEMADPEIADREMPVQETSSQEGAVAEGAPEDARLDAPPAEALEPDLDAPFEEHASDDPAPQTGLETAPDVRPDGGAADIDQTDAPKS